MRLISVNIEGDRHLDKIENLFGQENPDVVCLQEVFRVDLERLSQSLGMEYIFAPMAYYDFKKSEKGPAIFSRKFLETNSVHYSGKELAGKTHYSDDKFEEQYITKRYQLVTAKVVVDDETYQVNTTHMPVTEDGDFTQFQLEAVEKLLIELDKQSQCILCGDTNAPRGKEAFEIITSKYKDNIPLEYETSIDDNLHRAGPIPFMVDGLFTTPGYRAENVKLVSGVSDHCAIVADIYIEKE